MMTWLAAQKKKKRKYHSDVYLLVACCKLTVRIFTILFFNISCQVIQYYTQIHVILPMDSMFVICINLMEVF